MNNEANELQWRLINNMEWLQKENMRLNAELQEARKQRSDACQGANIVAHLNIEIERLKAERTKLAVERDEAKARCVELGQIIERQGAQLAPLKMGTLRSWWDRRSTWLR